MVVMTLGTIGWTVGSLLSKYNRERRLNRDGMPKKEEDLHVLVKTACQMVVAGTKFTLVAIFTGEYGRFELQSVQVEYCGAMTYQVLMGSILPFSSSID